MFESYRDLKRKNKELEKTIDISLEEMDDIRDKVMSLSREIDLLKKENEKLKSHLLIYKKEMVFNGYGLSDIKDKVLCINCLGHPRIIVEVDEMYSLRILRFIKGQKVIGRTPEPLLNKFGRYNVSKEDLLEYMKEHGYLLQTKERL